MNAITYFVLGFIVGVNLIYWGYPIFKPKSKKEKKNVKNQNWHSS